MRRKKSKFPLFNDPAQWQAKTLIVWGRNDILPAAAEVAKQVVPAADLRYFDGGHLVLDECADPVAEAIIETFSR